MKRILCLIENLGSGGAERQLTGLAVMLKQQDHEVEVWYYVKNEFYLPYLKENGVEGRYLHKASNPQKRFFVLRKEIKAYNPDTIISYSASTSMIASLLKMLGSKYNLIVSERNTTQVISAGVKLRFFLYRWADFIVPNSYSQKYFIDNNFPKLSSKVKVITNFVDTDKFKPSDESKSLPLNEETRMVCVGRLMPQKNLPRFIEAVGKIVHDGYVLKVDWFGQDLKDSYSVECHKNIQEHHLDGVFVFHTPSSTIQEEYQKADVFCLPSLYEGFPNVLCEAMSCGKPVLCSRVCDNPNIVQEGINGFLFDPLSVEDMVKTIEDYLNLPLENKIEMGKRNREIAVELFSAENLMKNYVEIM